MVNRAYSFQIKDFDVGGRIGLFEKDSKRMMTPTLFPVVSPYENLIPPRELYEDFGVEALFTNAYIIYNKDSLRERILSDGLHKYLDFPGLIATDSGGFQDYMYGGDLHVQPEEIESFQEDIGSDFPVILDIPVQTSDSYDEAKWKVEETLRRARSNIERRRRQDAAWFGPIHGSIYYDLLRYSAEEMSKLDFGVYAIGGVVKTFIDYRFPLDISILLYAKKYLRPDVPVHMFGLGLPNFFALAVAAGADTFDSAAYYLYARDGRYFSYSGTRNLRDLTEFPCHCPICTSYTPSELFSADKKERIRALSAHNLYFSFSEIRAIRQAIREGTLWELVEQRVMAHPKLRSAFRIFKKEGEYFIQVMNLKKARGIKFLSEMTFYRPSVRLYYNRVFNYHVSPSREHLLFIPELDTPSLNHPLVKKWLKEVRRMLRKNEKEGESRIKVVEERNGQDAIPIRKFGSYLYKSIEVIILSNLVGPIPLPFSEVYPASQHEGEIDISLYPVEHSYLLDVCYRWVVHVLRENSRIRDIHFLFPVKVINEYSEEADFNLNTHIISSLHKKLESSLEKDGFLCSIHVHSSIQEFSEFLFS